MDATDSPSPGASLAEGRCQPCRGQVAPMDPATVERLSAKVPEWTVAKTPDRLLRRIAVPDFRAAQALAMDIANLCEEEGHHAEITFGWGYVAIQFWTHKIGGLHDNDFIMAAKVDRLAQTPAP